MNRFLKMTILAAAGFSAIATPIVLLPIPGVATVADGIPPTTAIIGRVMLLQQAF